jgi:HSP20 family protein
MYMVKWNPFRELEKDFFRPFFGSDEEGAWQPAVDVYEKENELRMKVELPGVRQKDIEIQVENDELTIKAERKTEDEKKDKQYYRRERRYGLFKRVFKLNRTVDAEKISAKYEDGVLELLLPKTERAKSHKIKIAA